MSDETKELHVIVFQSNWHDWLSGLTNLAVIAGVSIANHRWGGGSTWIDSLVVILGFAVLVGMVFRKTERSWRGNIDEAIDHLVTLRDKNF
ncbi:MAG: hypothetical protein RIC14_00005 [Filomicrobium sp.]